MHRWLLILSLLSLPAVADEASRLQQAAFAPQLQHQNTVLERKNQSLLRYLWAVCRGVLQRSPGQPATRPARAA